MVPTTLSLNLIRRSAVLPALLAGLVTASPAAARDMVSCMGADDGASILLTVESIKSHEGKIRAQIYNDQPDDFLAKGKKLVRVEVPASGDEIHMCVPLPGPGDYALVVMHDVNGNGKADFFSEGFGFSNNPSLGLGKPDLEKVLFQASAGVTEQRVKLKYLLGSPDKKEKRKSARRR